MNINPIENFPAVKSLLATLQDLEVESIICYGSYAAGLQDDKSDLDLLVLIDSMPAPEKLQNIYNNIVGINNVQARNLAHWGNSWSLLNTTLKINNFTIDIGYNTTTWVRTVVHNLMHKNLITFEEFSFRPYTFLGLLEQANCIYDKNFFIREIKTKIRPFPFKLKQAIVQEFWPMLNDCYNDLIDATERNIGNLAYQYFIFTALDAMCELLFVINDVYNPASKRTEFYLFNLKQLPVNFRDFIKNQLPNCYLDKKAFITRLHDIITYIKAEITAQQLLIY